MTFVAVFANYGVFFYYKSGAVASAFSFWVILFDYDVNCLIGYYIFL